MDKVLPGDLLGICIGELFAFKNSVEKIALHYQIPACSESPKMCFLVPITTFRFFHLNLFEVRKIHHKFFDLLLK